MKFFVFALAFTIAACTPLQTQVSDVRLAAERTSPGVVRLTLHNDSTQPVGYNLCPSVLEQESGATWSQIRTGEICTMEIRPLNPGETATFDKTLPTSLGAGTYRYVARVEKPMGTSAIAVPSGSFTLP